MIEAQSDSQFDSQLPEDSGHLEMVNPGPELLRKKKKKKIAVKEAANPDYGIGQPSKKSGSYLPTFSQAFHQQSMPEFK